MLKLKVESLEGVAEPLRAMYEERDGGFHLKVEGLEDTSGLKSALEKERKERKEYEKKAKALEGLGKTPEEIQTLITEREELERQRLAKEGDFTKLLNQHQEKWAKEKSTLEAELNAARASERAAIIDTSVTTALTKAGATEEGIDLLPGRLVNRIKFELVDGKRVIKIMQADGETPMAGKGPDGTATFDDLVAEATAKWPSLFKGSGNSGTGKQPGAGGGGSARTITRADFNAKSPAEQMKIMTEGKIKVVD